MLFDWLCFYLSLLLYSICESSTTFYPFESHYFEQKLDHYDPWLNNITFMQRYLIYKGNWNNNSNQNNPILRNYLFTNLQI